MPIHRGLRRFFDSLVLLGRLTDGRVSREDAAEMRGFTGAVNFEFTGDDGAVWHCVLDGESVVFGRGGDFDPRATISLSPETFFELMRGEASFAIAQMTGRVRVRGDGHAGMLWSRHLIRFGSYFLGVALLSLWSGVSAIVLGLLMAVYFSDSFRRAPAMIRLARPCRPTWVIVLIPCLRVVGDLAKMSGFVCGVIRWRPGR